MTSPTRLSLWLSAAAVIVCLLSTAISVSYHWRVLDRLETIERLMEDRMLSTKWTSGKLERTLTTIMRDGESAAAMAARHRVELEAAMAAFPRDA